MTAAIERLRKLAEEATVGPWHESAGSEVYKVPHFSIVRCAYQRDASFIAAANPAVILALLDVVDAGKERVEYPSAGSEAGLRAALARLESAVGKLWTILSTS